MSNPDLLLHLALDELLDDTLYDSTTARRNGRAHNVAIVEDKDFGQCLELKGSDDSYVEFPSIKAAVKAAAGDPPSLTVTLWVKPAVPDRKMCLVKLDHIYGIQDQTLALSLLRSSDGRFTFADYGVPSTQGRMLTWSITDPQMKSDPSGWFHFAAVGNREIIEFYLNGRPIRYLDKAGSVTTQWLDHASFGSPSVPEKCFLGKYNNRNVGAPFEGRVAQLRVYKRALTPEEINWEMEGDRPVQYRYRITHPLDFSLENRDADPTLFMDGHPDGQQMTLRVDNVSSGVIKFAPLPDPSPSEANCHFELAFRPGTLAPDSLGKVTVSSANDCWKVASKQWKDPNDRDSLYLLCTKPEPLPDPGLTLQLEHLLADARYGTRTSLVDFRFQNLRSGADEPISGSIQQNLDIVNHQGRRNIPLHVGFAGSNIVLNNSTKTTTLRLRVTNILPHTDLLNAPDKTAGSGVLRFGEGSFFILTFDGQNGTDWALDEENKVGGITVSYGKGKATTDLKEGKEEGGGKKKDRNPWQREIPLKGITLGPGEHLEIKLDNVTASGAYGHTNLYLDYRNVPGYWDGRFTCVIDKAPLTYFNGNVGIGVAEPVAELEVKGTLKTDSLIVNQSPEIKPVQLLFPWKAFGGKTPQYYQDALGIIHLMGQCSTEVRLSLNYPTEVGVSREWQWAFRLPDKCAPAGAFELEFPFRAILSRPADKSQPGVWHSFILRGYNDNTIGLVNVSLFAENPEVPVVLQVFLDGISYLARS